MGFKDMQNAARQNAFLGNTVLKGDTIKVTGSHFKKPVAGAVATVDTGADKKGVTLTRVAALGVFALAAKKNKSSVYVTIEWPDGESHLVEVPASKETAARQFAAKVNAAGRRYGGDSPE